MSFVLCYVPKGEMACQQRLKGASRTDRDLLGGHALAILGLLKGPKNHHIFSILAKTPRVMKLFSMIFYFELLS